MIRELFSGRQIGLAFVILALIKAYGVVTNSRFAKTISRTARLNDLHVSRYLEYVLDHIQTKDINDLLPYSPKLDKSLKNT